MSVRVLRILQTIAQARAKVLPELRQGCYHILSGFSHLWTAPPILPIPALVAVDSSRMSPAPSSFEDGPITYVPNNTISRPLLVTSSL